MSELVRANRISVQGAGKDLEARFWRTHKQVSTVTMEEASYKGYVADSAVNSTAQRELFRAWMIKNSEQFGVNYDSEDRRVDTNRFPSKYTSDTDLLTWASRMVKDDVAEWTAKIAEESKIPDLTVTSVEAESITPVDAYHNKPVNSKYSNGNWAYAEVSVVATIQTLEDTGYVTMKVMLVSGQLKKPSQIGELGYTYTGFRTELTKDIPGCTPVKEDTKKSSKKDTKTEKPADKPAKKEKKSRKTTKKESKKDKEAK